MVRARTSRDAAPYNIVLSTLVFSIIILSSRGALGRSYSSRVYLRKLHHALRMRLSMNRLVLWLMFPQVYKLIVLNVYLAGCLYAEYGGGLRNSRRTLTYDLSLASDTVRPNAAHTTTITPIIFMSCLGKCEATPASSAYSMPHSKVARAGSPSVASPDPSPLLSS